MRETSIWHRTPIQREADTIDDDDVEYAVPEISRFFGIIIRMFPEVGAPHHRPHFHAAYQEFNAVFALDPVECVGGSLPRTQQRLVEAWAEIHHDELLHDWALLHSGRPPLKIEPLR